MIRKSLLDNTGVGAASNSDIAESEATEEKGRVEEEGDDKEDK